MIKGGVKCDSKDFGLCKRRDGVLCYFFSYFAEDFKTFLAKLIPSLFATSVFSSLISHLRVAHRKSIQKLCVCRGDEECLLTVSSP